MSLDARIPIAERKALLVSRAELDRMRFAVAARDVAGLSRELAAVRELY